MNFIYNTYNVLIHHVRPIYNYLIFNAVIKNPLEATRSTFSFHFSELKHYTFLDFNESQHVYYSCLDIIKSNLEIPITDPLSGEVVFNTKLLVNFKYSGNSSRYRKGKKIFYDSDFKYTMDDQLIGFLKTENTAIHVIKKLEPIALEDSKNVEFIETLSDIDKAILIALIKNYYPNYYNEEWDLYNSKFRINFSSLKEYCSIENISFSDIKSSFKKFMEPDYWLYVFDNKLPFQCKLIEDYFILEYDNPEDPEINYKYSLEFITLLRNLNFQINHLGKYGVDYSNFIPLDEINR